MTTIKILKEISNNENFNNTNNIDDNVEHETMGIDKTDYWLNGNQCSKLTDHQLKDNWYHFRVCDENNAMIFKWLKHKDLKHLKIYNLYLKRVKLTIDEVAHPQWFLQVILDHQYNEKDDNIEFLIKWKGYSHV